MVPAPRPPARTSRTRWLRSSRIERSASGIVSGPRTIPITSQPKASWPRRPMNTDAVTPIATHTAPTTRRIWEPLTARTYRNGYRVGSRSVKPARHFPARCQMWPPARPDTPQLAVESQSRLTRRDRMLRGQSGTYRSEPQPWARQRQECSASHLVRQSWRGGRGSRPPEAHKMTAAIAPSYPRTAMDRGPRLLLVDAATFPTR